MERQLRDGMRPSPKVLEIIVSYMNRVASPVYLGILSLEVRWSLERTQQMLNELEDKGMVRKVTDEEKRKLGRPLEAILYVLTDRPSLSKAYG